MKVTVETPCRSTDRGRDAAKSPPIRILKRAIGALGGAGGNMLGGSDAGGGI
jgi:hypothetical protein